MTLYPGKISRQALVEFCQGLLPAIELRNDQLLDALHYAETAKNVHTIHALEIGLMENYGKASALRSVCEWAKEVCEEEKPIDDVAYDMDALREKLKEKFG